MMTEQKKRNRLSNESKKEIYDLYKKGGVLQKELAEMFDVSKSTVCTLIKDFEASAEETAEKVNEVADEKKPLLEFSRPNEHVFVVKRNYHPNRERRENKKDMKKKNNQHTRSLNSHQIKAINKKKNEEYIDKAKEAINMPITSQFDTLEIGNVIVEPKDFGLVKLDKDATPGIHKVGLVGGRHTMPVNRFIFPQELTQEELYAFDQQMTFVVNYIKTNVTEGDTILLYCTGIQSCLGSLMRACLETKHNLILKHYDSENGSYRNQVILDTFGPITNVDCVDNPFSSLFNRGDVYTYNTTFEDLVKMDEIYCVTVNQHVEDGATCSKFDKTVAILISSWDDFWEIQKQMTKQIQLDANRGAIKMSVLGSYINIYPASFTWGANICKSFNFK